MALAALAMIVLAGSASAAAVHPTENYGFGPDGTSATNFKAEYSGKVRAPIFDQEHHRLLAFGVANCCGPSSLYAWSYNGPGSFTPLPGFPISASEVAFSTVQLAIDESGGPADGTIYKATSGTDFVALNPDGTSKQGVTFESEEGYKGGAVAVGPEGHVFGANNGKHQIEEFAPTGGTPLRVISLSKYTTAEISGLAIDRQTGDLFIRVYGSTYRLTRQSNYEDAAPLIISTPEGGSLVVDSSARVLYATAHHSWGAYDVESGSLLEERAGAGVSYETSVDGLAVDEATHTLFTANSAENYWQMEEWRPLTVATVTTGPPTGNATVSGSVDPAGAGDITECKFEYVPSSAFNAVEEVTVTGATGGTFQLYNYSVNTYSEPIPYNATVAQFSAAAEATWGAGTISVTGAAGGPYTVEFVGPLAGVDNPNGFYANGEGLTPGGSAQVTSVIKREGGASTAWKSPSTAPCSAATPISTPTAVSAELTGLTDETTYHYRLVAVDANGRSVGRDRTITPHRVNALTTEAADEITRTAAELHGSYVGTGEADQWWFEWGTSPSALTSSSAEEPQTATGQTPVSTSAEGLTANKVYYFRVSAKNAASQVSHGEILQFKTLPAVESLETKPATEVKPHTATLNASLVGDGTETGYFFEWGTSEHYGNTTPVKKTSATGSTALEPAPLAGLALETTYHYRIVAKNALGTTRGADMTFKTLPAVAGLEVKPVTELESHSATLQGVFTGNGDPTHYHYRWGPSSGYGHTTPPMESSATGVTSLAPYHLEGLVPEVTYHVQIVATNSEGETKSADATFTTPPSVRGLKTLPASEIGQEEIQLNAEFAGNGQDTKYWFEYGTSTKYDHKAPATPLDAGSPTGTETLSTTITDYVAYTTYHYRVVAENEEGETRGNDETFETLAAELPNIRNEQATEVAPTSATLGAEVDPMRWKTVYLFEYGTTSAYGESTELNPEPIGEDHSFHEVTEAVSELAPATIYHFRIVAINYTGTRFGPDQTFATPGAPTVDLASANAITATAAHLTGLVNPNSAGTTVRFEYGPSEAYGSSTGSIDIGGGHTDREAAADVTGLQPNTIYHYRVVATNTYGTITSRDQTFTTAQGGTPPPGPEPLRCKKPKVKRHGKCVRPRHHHRHHKRKRHHNSKLRNG